MPEGDRAAFSRALVAEAQSRAGTAADRDPGDEAGDLDEETADEAASPAPA